MIVLIIPIFILGKNRTLYLRFCSKRNITTIRLVEACLRLVLKSTEFLVLPCSTSRLAVCILWLLTCGFTVYQNVLCDVDIWSVDMLFKSFRSFWYWVTFTYIFNLRIVKYILFNINLVYIIKHDLPTQISRLWNRAFPDLVAVYANFYEVFYENPVVSYFFTISIKQLNVFVHL